MKRSLHIGINDYPGTGSDLSGCVNDANDWREAMEALDFQATSYLDGQATKTNMHEAISKIVGDTGQNDIAVITYSGHGTWVSDQDGDESDGRDEALCPHDITQGEILTDDELYEIFSERKRGARIIFVSDSCHSGTGTGKFARYCPMSDIRRHRSFPDHGSSETNGVFLKSRKRHGWTKPTDMMTKFRAGLPTPSAVRLNGKDYTIENLGVKSCSVINRI